MIEGKIIPVYSQKIMNEYQEVLGRKKFGFPPDIVDYLLSAITKYGVFIEPIPTDVILPDMKNLPFYEVVLEKREDGAYLVTGNLKHFPVPILKGDTAQKRQACHNGICLSYYDTTDNLSNPYIILPR